MVVDKFPQALQKVPFLVAERVRVLLHAARPASLEGRAWVVGTVEGEETVKVMARVEGAMEMTARNRGKNCVLNRR